MLILAVRCLLVTIYILRRYDSLSQNTPEGQTRFEGVTNLIEHPSKMRPPAEPEKMPEIPVILTAKERKKLRRQTRAEAQKDLQEKIRLGLLPPPEPKGQWILISVHYYFTQRRPVGLFSRKRNRGYFNLYFLSVLCSENGKFDEGFGNRGSAGSNKSGGPRTRPNGKTTEVSALGLFEENSELQALRFPCLW